MLTLDKVNPALTPGTYLAITNPLCLARVEAVFKDISTPTSEYEIRQWLPGAIESEVWRFGYPPDNRVLLKHSTKSTESWICRDLKDPDLKVRTGDVFESSYKFLLFSVVEGSSVTLYADEPIPAENDLVIALIQRGPGPEEKLGVKNRYERILNEIDPDIPVVRPMGGFLLRSQNEDPLLLPATNLGIQASVLTNVQLLRNSRSD